MACSQASGSGCGVRGCLPNSLGWTGEVKKKRLIFVFDCSASMFRFNGQDKRLNRSLEAAVMMPGPPTLRHTGAMRSVAQLQANPSRWSGETVRIGRLKNALRGRCRCSVSLLPK